VSFLATVATKDVHLLIACCSRRSPLSNLVTASLSHTPKGPPVLADVRVLPPKGLNTQYYLDLNHFSRETPWAHAFMHDYALWLGPVLLAVVFVAVYALAWWRRAPRVAGVLFLGGVGTIVALGLNQLVGHAAKELRPYDSHPHALVLVAKTTDYSFPSDHSIVAGDLTLALLLVLGSEVWRRREPALGALEALAGRWRSPGAVRVLAAANIVLGLFLCFARVYVGAHYPGDVVAGYLLSAVVVLLFSLLRPLAYRAVDAVEPTPMGIFLRRPLPAAMAAHRAPADRPTNRPTARAADRPTARAADRPTDRPVDRS